VIGRRRVPGCLKSGLTDVGTMGSGVLLAASWGDRVRPAKALVAPCSLVAVLPQLLLQLGNSVLDESMKYSVQYRAIIDAASRASINPAIGSASPSGLRTASLSLVNAHMLYNILYCCK
jgi:hypothetical protein